MITRKAPSGNCRRKRSPTCLPRSLLPRRTFQIHPDLTYRLNNPISVHCIGLAPEQQKAAADDGALAGEKPFRLTANGPWAWLGEQLLHIKADRLAKARASTSEIPTQANRKRKAAA
jgi:hypothetical protein